MRPPQEASSRPPIERVGAMTALLGRALGASVAALLAVLVMLAATETATWALLEHSWAPLGEIQGLLLVWLTFLTAAWGVHGGLHLGMGLLVQRLARRPRRFVEGVAAILVATFGALCAWHGARLALSVVNTLPATGWSAAWQYLPAVVGGALVVLLALCGLAMRGNASDGQAVDE